MQQCFHSCQSLLLPYLLENLCVTFSKGFQSDRVSGDKGFVVFRCHSVRNCTICAPNFHSNEHETRALQTDVSWCALRAERIGQSWMHLQQQLKKWISR